MSETTATPAMTTPSKAKKAKTVSAAKKSKAPATHPPVSEMVLAAVKSLKERNGSSAQAIKKYIAVNYKVEVDRLQPFIKKYLKSAVTSGALTQTKGKGANGSFKLTANQTKDKKTTTTKVSPKPAPKKTPSKKTVVKKAAKPSVAPKVTKTTPKSEKKAIITKTAKVKKTVEIQRRSPPRRGQVEKKSKTPKTAKSPKKVKSVKPKPAKKTPKKAPQKSSRKA